MSTGVDQEVLAQLVGIKASHPELSELVDAQREILEARSAFGARVSAPTFRKGHALERIERGIPMLRPGDIEVDWLLFAAQYRQVCSIAGRHRPDLAVQLQGLGALADDMEALPEMTAAYLEAGSLTGNTTDLAVVENGREQQELLEFVLNHTLRPYLDAFVSTALPQLEEEMGVEWRRFWQRGACPVCGGEPDFAFLDREDGSRHLVCSRCDTFWVFPRIKCSFCGNTEPARLSYYPSEDEVYRVYVCGECRRYLKTIDLRRADKRVLFPVERIATVALDVAARGEGYR